LAYQMHRFFDHCTAPCRLVPFKVQNDVIHTVPLFFPTKCIRKREKSQVVELSVGKKSEESLEKCLFL
ncbi:MAG: hypothetical protein J6R89_01075, partial [Clostridia bacterium]|nr:hypothetical protein [Clostridia bacterium]